MIRWLALSALLVVLDQLSKFAMTRVLASGNGIEVTPFLNLVLVYNRGAAFSLLSSASGWQNGLFIVIALAAAVWIVWLLRRHANERLFCTALSLILGGAVGNLIDRVLFGAVVDFLDFHAAGWHWPAFNLADSSITIGALLLIWESLRPRHSQNP
ncbi:MAG: lipoprotein signal peptidase [Betaproteobacteria bacterium]|nr:lipoprotein signal peptidase [Betaproteobacteria bacterium]